MLQNLLDNWLGWLGLSGVGIGLLSLLPGVTILTSVLKIIASLFEMAGPIIGGIISGVVWIWQKILWPGLLDIFDSVATIITVLIIVGAMFMYFDLKYKVETHNLRREVNSIKRVVPKTEDVQPEEFNPTKLLPWNW